MTSAVDLATRLGAKKTTTGYIAKCPAHDDRAPSLSIKTGDTGATLLHCHAGCDLGAVCDALDVRKTDLFPDKPAAKTKVTVVALATHKKLDAAFLRSLGLRDHAGGGVGIPYCDVDGNEVLLKRRVALVAKEGSIWPKGLPLMPYGLERVSDARETDQLVLVEGESDCWTLWHHEIPALGVPGASSTSVLRTEHVSGIKTIYLLDERDKGAATFLPGAAKRLAEVGFKGDVRVLRLDGVKDPSELHTKDPASFKEKFQEALAAAKPIGEAINHSDSRHDSPLPFRLASDIPMVPITWLWRGRIAAGMLAILDGDPGLGKSTLLSDLTARITRGMPMPGEDIGSAPAGVVLISFEEHQGAVMTPRLVAAGADLCRVAIWNLDDVSFNLVDSLAVLADMIRAVGAKLVVIDPLMAALPTSLNAHRDQDVRSVLAPLSKLAENTSAAILMVRHLNKAGGVSAVYRGGGSIGIIAAARTGLTLATDPKLDDADEDDGSRVLATSKCNVGRAAPSLRLRIVSAPSPAPGIEVARAEWGTTCKESADNLLQPSEERSAIAQAMVFVRDLMKDGPLPASIALEALAANGITDRTASRARKKLGVIAKREGIKGKWWWHLPEHLPERKTA